MYRNVFYIVALLVFCQMMPTILWAQRTDFDKIIQPTDKRAHDFSEVLVQLAWINNPKYEGMQTDSRAERENIKLAQKSWLDGVSASFNINQGNLQPASQNSFFPVYNFSASFNLGTILKTNHHVRAAKERLRKVEHNIDQEKLQLRAEVLSRYRNYLYAIEMVKLRTQALEDLRSSYMLAKNNFEKGTASFRTYIEAANAYNNANAEKVSAEHQLALARIEIEEIIGVKLDEVENMNRN